MGSSTSRANQENQSNHQNNSSVRASGSLYKLHIFHRNVTVDCACTKAEPTIGHFFIGLEEHCKVSIFGKYVSFLTKKIESEKEAKTIRCMQKLQLENQEKYFDTKTIVLTKEQYDKAFEFIKNRKLGWYIPLLADCADFVQSVYNAAGLPLYFTSVYRRDETTTTWAASMVRFKYSCIDDFISKFKNCGYGSNKGKIVDKLNVHEEDIIELPDGAFFVDIDDALQKILKISCSSKIDETFIRDLRIENMFNLLEAISLKNSHKRLSKVEKSVKDKYAQYDWNDNTIYNEVLIELKQLIKEKLDREEAKATEMSQEDEEPEAKRKKKDDFLKELVIQNLYHNLGNKIDELLKCKVERMMIEFAKRNFRQIYNKKLNHYQSEIKGRVSVESDILAYRDKFELKIPKLLMSTNEANEKDIDKDFEVWINQSIMSAYFSIKTEHRL